MKAHGIAICSNDGSYRFPKHEINIPPEIILSIKQKFSFCMNDWYKKHINENINIFDATLGEIPHVNDLLSLTISGSYHMVTDGFDWIRNLESLTLQAIEKNIPVFGICFGHQLIAKILGCTIIELENFMMGAINITLKEDGINDWLFKKLPPIYKVLFSRRQAVTNAPPGVKQLDANPSYIDVLSYGDTVRGVQFHPEITRNLFLYLAYVKETFLQHENILVNDLIVSLVGYEQKHADTLMENFYSHIIKK